MADSTRSRVAQEALQRWRSRQPSEKRSTRHVVVVERVVNSMAMENEPVSGAWVQQAKAKRTA